MAFGSSNGNGVVVANGAGATSAGGGLPDKAYQPAPGAVEGYTHSKKVGNYLIGRNLGAGSFATVKEALHVVTGERVAIKVINKDAAKTDPYVAKNLRREGRVMQLIRHPNIVQLLEVMETENSYYLVLELCLGGDFMTHLMKRRRLTEAETRRYVRQIVLAIDYIHGLGILHRDLKIENLLLTQEQNVKIIDFGLSNLLQSVPDEDGNIVTQLCRTQCGSPAYAAPEVLARKPYGTAVDVWSIGVNMFAMLTGNLPFTVKPYSIKALHHKMVNQELSPLPKTLSAGCRNLLMQLLNPQPETRIKLRDVMNHPWLNESVSRLRPSPFPNLLSREDLRQDVLQQVSQQLGLSVSEVTRRVLDNSPGPCLSAYHLLVTKTDRYCRQNPIVKAQSFKRSNAETQGTSSSDGDSGIGKGEDDATNSSPVDLLTSGSYRQPPQAATASPPLPLFSALPRREKTCAGCVPLSDAAVEATALVSLERAATMGNREGGCQTARPSLLPKCATRSGATSSRCWAQSERSGRAAKGSAAPPPPPPPPPPLPPQRIRTVAGRSSIQSLVTQRYHRAATGVPQFGLPRVPSRYQASGASCLSSLATNASSVSQAATSAAAAAAAAAAAPPPPPLNGRSR